MLLMKYCALLGIPPSFIIFDTMAYYCLIRSAALLDEFEVFPSIGETTLVTLCYPSLLSRCFTCVGDNIARTPRFSICSLP